MVAIASTLTGYLVFTLPKPLPGITKDEKVDFLISLGLDALKTFERQKAFLSFLCSSRLILIPLPFYLSKRNHFFRK